ncbi:hypothetical protein [Ornithinibacillus halotolerans]|uniref:Uncharacterized protein n=1 Tax=Ornithinibacillus halotolerans TaxID=1274357 RepID=A0A916WA04_9BACI|nr:hypothetical protein [Ornithinibacillus halotolerans]GGA79233.1 hypothetical protein GCM10008025_23330 [Ornithinibacillus halotolerans]
MDNKNEDKRKKKNDEKMDGANVGVVPGDTMATALDPFGSAAGPISVENSVTDEDEKKEL